MLTRFEVSNFKSIKHLALDLQPLMVLVGPNGAGKTNIVQALDLASRVIRSGTIEPIREAGYDEIIRREKRPARGGVMLGMTFEFSRHSLPARMPFDIVFSIRVTIRQSAHDDDTRLVQEIVEIREQGQDACTITWNENAATAISGNAAAISLASSFLRGVPARPRSEHMSLDAFGEQLQHIYAHSTTRASSSERTILLSRYIQVYGMFDDADVTRLRLDSSALRQDSVVGDRASRGFIGPAGEGLAVAVDRLRGRGKKASVAFRQLLEQLNAVFPRIEDVIPTRLQPGRMVLLFKERGITQNLGQSNVSDGVLHSLALLLALTRETRPHGILAIEEPENAIHPWPLRQMMARAHDAGPDPLLITTHSETVVDAIQDPGSLFIVEHVGDQGTTVTPARSKEAALDAILSESGMKLGQVWMGGGLGGVPTPED